MLQAAGKLFLIGLMILSAAGVTMAAPAQQSGAFLPAIVDFTTDTTSVAYADVEAGKAQATVSWHTINANGQYRVALEAYHLNTWASLAGSGEALPLSGTKTVTLPVPENFGPPTLRLTLKTAAGATIEQRFVTIAYAASDAPAPSIVTFETGAKGIDTNLLVQSNARVSVSWQIENRQPDTLIRIDQVLADGTAVSAEGPRRALWLPSQGSARLIPRSTSSRDDLHFRLSLVNVQDGTVYDQKDITLPVTGQILIAVPQTGTQQQTASVPRQSGISAFNAQSASGNVIVNWDASGADSVQLLQTVDQGGPVTLYIQLPPSGSMVVPAPGDASGVTYELRAQNADGSVATGEVSVSTGDGSGGNGG
jgi:hypothetical protein